MITIKYKVDGYIELPAMDESDADETLNEVLEEIESDYSCYLEFKDKEIINANE